MDELRCPGCGGDIFTELGWMGWRYWLRCRGCGITFDVVNEYGQPLRLPEDARADQEERAEMEAEDKQAEMTAMADKDREQLATLAVCTKKMDEALARLLENHPLNVTLRSYVVDAIDNLANVKHNAHVIDDVLNDPSITY